MRKLLSFSFLLVSAILLVFPTPSEANHLAAPACSGYYGQMTAKKWPGGKITITCEGAGRRRGACVGESAQIQPGQSYHFSRCNCLDKKNPCMKVSNMPKGCKVIGKNEGRKTNQTDPAAPGGTTPPVGGAPSLTDTPTGSVTPTPSGTTTSTNLACAANRESINEPINIDCSGEAEPSGPADDLTPTVPFYCIATDENCVTPGQQTPGGGGGAADVTPGAGEITPEMLLTPTEELLFTPTPTEPAAIPVF